ncbi:MAG: cellulose biosynthesis cyclic di-GMP-binding regulatory protein BcsB [Fimbriimonadaceae bacterium]|nr:cellulose biosynthesis cyclic di-GMP-binding regulatory protein BcsB [Fimbriimonadaceae bacterium]
MSGTFTRPRRRCARGKPHRALRFAFIAVAATLWAFSQAQAFELSLTRKDLTLSDPVNRWRMYYEIPKGVAVASQRLDLRYAVSPTILPQTASMTLVVNGTTFATRPLRGAPGAAFVQWVVDVPVRYLRPGTNELMLVSRQRSIDGPCKDLENDANWVRIDPGSRLITSVAGARDGLAAYPWPWLNPLTDEFVRSSLDLGATPTVPAALGMMGLASDWTARWPGGYADLHVGRGANRPAVKILGTAAATDGGESLPKGSGLLAVRKKADGLHTLIVQGDGFQGLARARRALANPALLEQAGGKGVLLLDRDLPAPPSDELGRIGRLTFADLGYPSVSLAGVFTQRATIYVRRPIRVNLGKQSHLRLKFRHSATLNPLRSLLTVRLNGTPVGSTVLDPSNANGGVLQLRLPLEELAKFAWQLEVEAYHDLGTIDCSKAYESVAWTVIDGDSELVLEPGGVEGPPSLVAFPYLRTRDGDIPERVHVGLPDHPSPGQYEALAAIGSLAGRANRVGVTFDNDALGSQTQLWIGTFKDVNRLAPIAENMHLALSSAGRLEGKHGITVMPGLMEDKVILQAIRSPFHDQGVVYVLLAADDAGFLRFARRAADPAFQDLLAGDVAILDRDGQVIVLKSDEYQALVGQLATEENRYTPPMLATLGAILLLVLIGAVWLVSQFVARRRPQLA